MSKCPQARPHRKALVFIGGRLLKLVIPLQVFLPLEVTYKPIVPLVLVPTPNASRWLLQLQGRPQSVAVYAFPG